MAAASARGRRRKEGKGSDVASRLREQDERLDFLELRLADLDPRTSKRTIERVTELEEVTRNNCNHMVEISGVRLGEVREALARAIAISEDLGKLADGIEQRIRRRCDEERKDAVASLSELKSAIDVVDEKVSAALTSMMDTEARCMETVRKADEVLKEDMKTVAEVKHELLHRAEQLESSMASLQIRGRGRLDAEYRAEQEEVMRASRSPSLDSRGLPGLMERAKRVAHLRARSEEGRPRAL